MKMNPDFWTFFAVEGRGAKLSLILAFYGVYDTWCKGILKNVVV